MACTQFNTYHSDQHEDRIPEQQNMEIGSDKEVTDGRQDKDRRYEVF